MQATTDIACNSVGVLARPCQYSKLSILYSKVDQVDPFETVVTMRRQKMKMVQKPMLYYYIFRCLADYVA